jgi:hypothetical protein
VTSRHLLITASAAIGLLALATSTSASAQAFGSAALGTYRDCSTAGAGVCDGTVEPDQKVVISAISGGASSTANTSLTLTGQAANVPVDPTSIAQGTVTFGDAALPLLKALSTSGDTERMGINEFGYQSYTNTGSVATTFSITGTLNIDSFSGSNLNGGLAGGAVYDSYVAVWTPDAVAGLTDPDSLFNALFEAPCGSGVLATGESSASLVSGAGSSTASVSNTTSACGGGTLMLAPGETVLVVAGLQLLTNRGGSIDALDTFTTQFTPGAGVNTAELRTGASILGGVPEPTVWALMLSGFFGAGQSLRRRRGALAAH